jgi:hypothetical protein
VKATVVYEHRYFRVRGRLAVEGGNLCNELNLLGVSATTMPATHL